MFVQNTDSPPAGQPAWPVSADFPNVPLHPQMSSDCCQSLRNQYPVTSPSPVCCFNRKTAKIKERISENDIGKKKLRWVRNLSAKARISQSSRSSSGTHVSTAIGPVSLAGSCFLGRRALDRRPFLCGVGVSAQEKQIIQFLPKMPTFPYSSGPWSEI